MIEWPPKWEDCFEPGSGRPVADSYFLHLRLKLEANASYFYELPDEQQARLTQILYTLDWYASAAAKELRGSPWSTDELRSLDPPPSAKADRKFKRWRQYQANQLCVDACARTRNAIFDGDWITAVEFSLVAGNRAIGGLVDSAFRNLQPLKNSAYRAHRSKESANRNDALRMKAQEIWTRRPDLSASQVANQIAKTSTVGNELSVASIRKIIAKKP